MDAESGLLEGFYTGLCQKYKGRVNLKPAICTQINRTLYLCTKFLIT